MSSALRCLTAAILVAAFVATTSFAQTATKTRVVYSANNSTTLPGMLRRSEGQAPTGDADVDATYDTLGDFYDAYFSFWNRNSYDNLGAPLQATVHYSVNYCNATTNSVRVIVGDGDPVNGCRSPAQSSDALVHELTHLLTQTESNLVFVGEAGALNESLSDISAAFVKAWVDGGRNGTLVVSEDTWRIGEGILAQPLRFMRDPAADGQSADYWSNAVASLPRQYGAGVGNLAFYLLAQGGTHPRSKSTVVVQGIGMERAVRVFYKANVDLLTANSNYAAARIATANAAVALGYSAAEQASVQNAWTAVGVGGGGNTPTEDVVLTNGVPVNGLSGDQGSARFFKLDVPAGQGSLRFTIAGGAGDADLYVRRGSRPSATQYDCRPFRVGSNETCTINSPPAGTYYVMLHAYAAYAGVTLTGTYAPAPPPGDPYLTNGVPVSSLAGSSGSQHYWRVAVPAERTLTVRISGGSGDADLYVRSGLRPTATSWSCRPYTAGNNEDCTQNVRTAGDWYIMVRGYTSYSGVTLTATY